MRCKRRKVIDTLQTMAGCEKAAAEQRLKELQRKWAGPRTAVLEEVREREDEFSVLWLSI